ncbi:MAG: hypothetical protein D6805_01765 [Planctomycetota bacterium]|nr:MAG: hypothetical protein D6805_01765 [Planctomycetota bacterium]
MKSRYLTFLAFSLVAFCLFPYHFLAAQPDLIDRLVGDTWQIKGKTADGTEYTGEARFYKWAGKQFVGGHFTTVEGERLASFFSSAKLNGNQLQFTFYIYNTAGFIRTLSELNIPSNQRRIRVYASYQLSDDGNTFVGGWKSKKWELNGSDSWVRPEKEIVVSSIAPNVVENGTKTEKTFTISGENFPPLEFLKPSDIVFLKDGKADPKIRVVEIYEVADDGSELEVKISIEKTALPGKRDIQVKKGLGKELFEIKAGTVKLPLGGRIEITPGMKVRVYVPNREGGILSFRGAEVKTLRFGSEQGEEIPLNNEGKFEVKKHGWYYLELSELSFTRTLSCQYIIEAETPKEKRPWNFWYFPFYDRTSPGLNLYDDGGAYEKLDKVLGNQPKKEGWKDFTPSQHMDYRDEKSKIKEFAEKYFKGWKWDLNSMSENDKEFLKKHNPSTIKGYAYCYQRSTDPKKSWWGHCWGAVVASSLYTVPEKTKTLKTADGSEVTFNQEEMEGLLTSYFTNHSIYPINYMNRCPAGRPTEKTGEEVDSFCDDFFLGLMEGLYKNKLPLASNLRAESRADSDKDQVWNHVIWKFRAELKEVEQKGDETFILVKLKITATNDVYPSTEYQSPRTEEFEFTLKYTPNGGVDRDNKEYQNWISASHFCPSYLWRIQRSADLNYGTENARLRGKLDKLIQLFGYKKIK